jgi:hypothetical protein
MNNEKFLSNIIYGPSNSIKLSNIIITYKMYTL